MAEEPLEKLGFGEFPPLSYNIYIVNDSYSYAESSQYSVRRMRMKLTLALFVYICIHM
jgi:hypothetical protein